MMFVPAVTLQLDSRTLQGGAMPYTIELQHDEELLLDVNVVTSKKSKPFAFAVSNQALFLPREKVFAVSDPTYFERVPLSEVRTITRTRLRPYFWWVLAGLMLVVGTVTTYFMVQPLLAGKGGEVSGLPPALVVVGLVIPFVVRERFGIKVEMVEGTFSWKPQSRGRSGNEAKDQDRSRSNNRCLPKSRAPCLG